MLRRRVLTIGGHVLSTALLGALPPLVLLATGVADALRGLGRRPVAVRWEWSRVLLFVVAYLVAETPGAAGRGLLCLRHRAWLGFGGATGAPALRHPP